MSVLLTSGALSNPVLIDIVVQTPSRLDGQLTSASIWVDELLDAALQLDTIHESFNTLCVFATYQLRKAWQLGADGGGGRGSWVLRGGGGTCPQCPPSPGVMKHARYESCSAAIV